MLAVHSRPPHKISLAASHQDELAASPGTLCRRLSWHAW
jgi:hypothetical protein